MSAKTSRNWKRHARAMNALMAYMGNNFGSEDMQSIVTDCLTDIMHLQDRGSAKTRRYDPLDVARAFYTATQHYASERKGVQNEPPTIPPL
jgi:hypothetical protein